MSPTFHIMPGIFFIRFNVLFTVKTVLFIEKFNWETLVVGIFLIRFVRILF